MTDPRETPPRLPAPPLERLPEGYELLGTLDPAGRVHRARWRGREVVVRVAATGTDEEARAELAALAQLRHPGIAGLVDHGALAEGWSWVAREWIEGSDLGTWAVGRTPEELGAAVARVAPALAHLHAQGVVHADLKAENVVVRPDGEPVLTDFGLARTDEPQGADSGVSGSLYAIAPEVLLGATPDERADLFALGVMLHRLLVGRRAEARRFYARFPREDFWRASETRPDELPPWARDVVVALLALDPADRPASAAAVGRTLAARLGVELPASSHVELLRFPPRAGREDWFETWWDRVDEAAGARWIDVGPAEDPAALADELRLVGALRGATVRRVDVPAEALSDAGALDAWVRRAAEAARGAVVFAALSQDSPGRVRAVEGLARARSGARDDAGATVVLARGAPPRSGPRWRVEALPALAAEDVERFLEAELDEPDAARRHAFAELVADVAEGSAARVDEVLERASRAGLVLFGGERPGLRPGPLPGRGDLAVAASGAPEDLSDGALALLAAAVAVGRAASVGSLLRAATGGSARDLAELEERGLLRRARPGPDGGRRVEARVDEASLTGRVSEETWRALHARLADELEQRGAPAARVLAHRWRARPDDARCAAAVVEELRALREAGAPELALDLGTRAARRVPGADGHAPLCEERARAWIALGRGERAVEAVASLEGRDEPAPRAALARVRGWVASLELKPDLALQHFAEAAALDADGGGDALFGEVQVLHGHGRDEDVVARVDAAAADCARWAALSPHQRTNLDVHRAMSLLRLGRSDEARDALRSTLEDAERRADAGQEAFARVNLGVLERKAGDAAAAARHLERACALAERAGHVARLALARAMLGGVLREAGELARAEQLFTAALEARERLGDTVGALGVRGMRGMLLADRGRPRAAIEELERAAGELERAGRRSDALLYRARGDEERARIGEAPARPPSSEDERLGEGDPRVLVSMARAAWMRGSPERAADLGRRAERLARSLGHAPVVAEAGLLARALRRAGRAAEGSAADPGSEPLPEALGAARDDARLVRLLDARRPDLDALAELADELVARGRHDRAARSLLALASREPDPERARRHAARAEDELARAAAGLSAREAEALRGNLLGFPDPWPGDLTPRADAASPDLAEMEIKSLLEINQRLLREENLDALLGTIVENALAVSGAERGFLMLEEDGELEFDTAMDSRRGDIEFPDLEVSQSVVREALERMAPVLVSNAVDDPQLGHAPSVVKLDLRSILCVPFAVDDALRGAIYLDHRLRQGAFTPRSEELVKLLADQAALAILQVRRLAEIRRLNRELGKQVVTVESDLRTARRRLQEVGLPGPAGGLVGNSPVMRDVHRLIERAAQSDLPVLVSGDSGTGKELAARALHELGPRAAGPYVSENCAALPPSLIEAELFGARKGAFTGADRDREGVFQRAHGGTLFLDEIGEMPLELQAKLLRVLETGEVRRVGDSTVRQVQFRLVAATNRDLSREVAEGRFRADLFYRLDGLRVALPPLAARTEDIPALVEHFLRLEEQRGGAPRRVSEAVVARLGRRAWPGNVRELFNELARLLVISPGDVDDPDLVREPAASLTSASAPGRVCTLEELERDAIERALEQTGGDKRRAAELLGISRSKLYQRLKEWREAEGADGSSST